MSQPAPAQQARERDRVVVREAAVAPVVGRDADGHRPLLRPHGAAGGEDLEREARAVLERAAVLVGAHVRQRRQERRQQVAVRHVDLEEVEPGRGRAPGRGHEVVAHRVHVGARHLARDLVDAGAVGQRGRREQRPVALVERLVLGLPHELRRALAPRVPELAADLRVRRGRGRSRRSAATPSCARRGTGRRSPGVIRPSAETQIISVITSPAPPIAARAEVDEVEVARRAVDRASTCPSATRRRGWPARGRAAGTA